MSTQTEVEVSYDVGNDFFKIILDSEMNYTCGIFEGADEFAPTDDLEQAQVNKLDRLHRLAHIGPKTKRVLDIGCGWGANLNHLAVARKVPESIGITLSRAQHEKIVERKIPNVKAFVQSYEDYSPAEKFDAILCICMMEHISTPEDARSGRHLKLYRDFFRRCHEWSNPGSFMSLQAIIRLKVPRNRQDLIDVNWTTYEIFPGGISLRLEDVYMSVSPYYEVMECKTFRSSYMKTTAAWRDKLRANQDEIVKRWGKKVYDDYERYLSTCVTSFEKSYQSLAQYQLRRVD